jgi:hypothetical protein
MRRLITTIALIGLLATAPAAFSASTTVTESYAALLAQIDSGQAVVAHVNERTRDIRVTLKSGTEEFVRFPESQHKALIDALLHHRVRVIYTKHTTAKKPVHHVLRYVAAGVVVVLLLIGGGVWVYTRGQRQPPMATPVDTPEPHSAGPPDPPEG